jgi:hypothetical protein
MTALGQTRPFLTVYAWGCYAGNSWAMNVRPQVVDVQVELED